MRIISPIVMHLARAARAKCAKPNSATEPLLTEKQCDDADINEELNADAATHKACDVKTSDDSLLAQYLLYRPL